MKILHVINNLDTGGAEMMLYKHLKQDSSYAENSHMVISLMSKGTIGPKISALGVEVFSLNLSYTNPLVFLYGVFRFLAIIYKYKPGVIQGWMYHASFFSLLGKVIFTKPLLIWNVRHSIYDVRLEKKFTRLFIYLCKLFSSCPSAIIFNSEISKLQHLDYGFTNKVNIVLPNGFDQDVFFNSPKSRLLMRTKLGISPNDFVVGHLARYHPMKNHLCLLEACSHLKSLGFDFKFIMAGRGVDYSNSDLADYISKNNLDKNVFLLGEISDTNVFYNTIDVFALTSTYGEAFPNVLGESMLSETPCISSDVGDSSFIVDNDNFIFNPITPSSLSVKILEVFHGDFVNNNAFKSNLRESIFSRFSIEIINFKYNQLYISCVN